MKLKERFIVAAIVGNKSDASFKELKSYQLLNL